MPELQERIQAALAGEYLVEREIGRGGMAQVFLARDLRHGRLVAVKVFLPEVAEGLGKGRFLREIKTAANLNDPRILPLFDSGEGEGLLYYIMPFVDGMSLAERLAVEGQLPIEDALAIARDVALALHHAHSKGVVHRDIKPGNILLSGSKVFVADFGIAHALEETGADKLTSTGFAIGTPAYMSPEQSGGYGTPDGRADIYSLGCVLYEMLVGEPPYTGRSTHAILARHSVERAPSARAVRETVPWAVEQAIHKALAKMPADRFSTAAEFEAALAPERLTRPGPVARGKSINPVKLGVAAVGLVVLIVMLLWKPWRMVDSGGSPWLSEDMIAILPFRISGVAGSWLSQAAASASALVVQRLPDEGGHRAAFPAAVDRAIAEILPARDRPLSAAEERRVGEAVGAGLLFEGQIAPAGNAVSIIATLVETRSGAIVARSPEVTGTADGLPAILDRVVAELLITLYERDSRDRARLLGRPLPALRAYLNGERAFARGMFRASVAAYDRALAIDSGFALAALGVASAGRFVSDTMMLRGAEKARANAAALADEDLLLLEALTPPVWPNERSIPKSDSLWEAAARADSLRPTAWYHLGEALFHDGPWTGAPDILQQASAAFRHALDVDPTFIVAMRHQLDLAASRNDTGRIRELAPLYLARDSVGELADYYRWRTAVALGNGAARELLRARFDSLGRATLERIVNVAQLDGVALEDAEPAAEALWSRSGVWGTARWAFVKQRELALNRGKPSVAAAVTRRWIANQPLRARDRLSEVVDALFWDADTLFASQLIASTAPTVDAAPPAREDPTYSYYFDLCAVSLWRASRKDLASLGRAISLLRRVPKATDPYRPNNFIPRCADILDAELAAATGRRDAMAALERLDSIARTATPSITWIQAASNLTAARLWERAGELPRALRATRRRVYITDIDELRALVAHSTFLREEGRLAALVGEREAAREAYRKYLALRSVAEPALAAQVAAVRAALDSLGRIGGS